MGDRGPVSKEKAPKRSEGLRAQRGRILMPAVFYFDLFKKCGHDGFRQCLIIRAQEITALEFGSIS